MVMGTNQEKMFSAKAQLATMESALKTIRLQQVLSKVLVFLRTTSIIVLNTILFSKCMLSIL